MNLSKEFSEQGFNVVNNVYNNEEVVAISNFINNLDTTNPILEKLMIYLQLDNSLKSFQKLRNYFSMKVLKG